MTQLTGSPLLGQRLPDGGTIHSIGIAGIKAVKAPDRIRTVLGSCIGIAVFDRAKKIGGMAHVILPDSSEGSGDPGKFADTAVDILIDQVLTEGAEHKHLVAKIAGGAAMFGDDHTLSLGLRNADAVKERLRAHGIRVAAEAVGGKKGRKMVLDPASGDVQVQIIGESPENI